MSSDVDVPTEVLARLVDRWEQLQVGVGQHGVELDRVERADAARGHDRGGAEGLGYVGIGQTSDSHRDSSR
jgi:hypothetical protein